MCVCRCILKCFTDLTGCTCCDKRCDWIVLESFESSTQHHHKVTAWITLMDFNLLNMLLLVCADGVALTLAAIRKDDKADLSLRSVYNYGNYGLTAVFNTSDKVNVLATIDKVGSTVSSLTLFISYLCVCLQACRWC